MINFNFGKKKPDKRELIKISIIVSIFIAVLSSFSGINETKLWDLLDEFQRKYMPLGILNELIIKDPDKIERRIIRDVDREIERITKEYDAIINESDKKYKPKYIEEKNDETVCYTDECKSISPPIRICASWIDDCVKKTKS